MSLSKKFVTRSLVTLATVFFVERRRKEVRALDDHLAPAEGKHEHRMAYYEPQPKMSQLYQDKYGRHYMDLFVGTPPQRQTLTIDTNGFLTVFPCTDCSDCAGDSEAHTNLSFNESASRTFQKYSCENCFGECVQENNDVDAAPEEKCVYTLNYGKGGYYKAEAAKDMAYPGGPHENTLYPPLHWDDGMSGVLPDHSSAFTFRLSFGCQTDDNFAENGLFQTQLANGIVGMGPSDAAIWKQMSWDDVIPDSGFSLCFGPRQQIESSSDIESGAITLGGTDSRLHNTPMLYAKDFRNASLAGSKYTVHVRKVYLRRHGGESVRPDPDRLDEVLFELRNLDQTELNRGGVTIASMAVGTYMRDVLEEPFREEWKKIVGFDYTNDSLSLSAEEISKLPTILLQLVAADEQTVDVNDPYVVTGLAGQLGDQDNPRDIVVAIPPQHYMVYDPNDKTYYSSFYFLKDADAEERSILGANFLMGHDVHFDVAKNSMRIGFSESTCEYNAVVEKETNYFNKKEITTFVPMDSSSKDDRGNKCGGWCIFGKLAGAFMGALTFVGCYFLYKKYTTKKLKNDEDIICINKRGDQKKLKKRRSDLTADLPSLAVF